MLKRRAADAVAVPACSTAATDSVVTMLRAIVAAGHAQDLGISGAGAAAVAVSGAAPPALLDSLDANFNASPSVASTSLAAATPRQPAESGVGYSITASPHHQGYR